MEALAKVGMDTIAREEQVRIEGKIEGKMEIAKKMLSEGMPTELITKITGLKKDEI